MVSLQNHTKIMKWEYESTGGALTGRPLNVCGYKLDMNLLPRRIKELVEEAESKYFNSPQKSPEELDIEDEMNDVFN